MHVSCAFPTTMSSPDDIRVAEEIGYHRAWLYDTPQQSPDVWMSLALAAERTSRIGLGPGVLIPTLRHPMTNAAATAALEALAPGRVAVSFGTGFTGRRAMGYGAISWRFMVDYIEAFRSLLRGETIEWDGARMRMLHPEGSGAARPVDVPVLIGAIGPKGQDIARRLGDGLYVTTTTGGLEPGQFDWVAYLYWGTVLGDGEDVTSSPRVQAAAGPGGALAYHATYELSGPDAVAAIPGGPEWLASIGEHDEAERHLAVHTGHCIELNEADRVAWAVTGGALLPSTTVTGSPTEVRRKIDDLGAAGVTEVVYQPSGPDIRRELETMYAACTA
ncbi:LLM class flavin-dependent oxidoreductase [Desertimonas flava]|uniref:LLM class flavin-dependent oxidoreductase n=1 Tax=Desertimonas flava TaxID=2064846 RepID=UPI000E34C83A|nr:LLM class flavin-dependent oxidoreductase [Desertimonas flava]